MADFTATVYQNEFLPDGGTDVHAIVTVTCAGAGAAGQSGSGDAGEIIIVDTSGSMGRDGVQAAAYAAQTALDQILDGVWFAVISGNDRAQLAFPPSAEPVMVRMDPYTRQAAKDAVSRFYADGGTAMGTWLRLASRVFATVPSLSQKHALLLTDGENQHETPEALTQAIESVTGQFQCDARGVGVAWQVDEVRRISQALLGTVDIIPAPDQLAAEFAKIIQNAMSRGVAQADLRVWAPQGAEVLFVRQVAPTVDDLTARRTAVNPLTGSYPTGSWGDESRDYHVAIRLAAKAVGQEQLAARVQLVLGDQTVAQGLVKALWSADDALTTRISPEVAHYTGQTELAQAIQDGLAAKAAGDTATATTKLGRAVQLAAATGNEEATTRLRKVVDIDDQETGTVRLKRTVEKADEMALDTASTKTTRVRK
ncbi:VWA domain-containing protein [Kribbella sp. GL6]|uniref:vWA domain-containing protein n=1 Tax=Kribbella sp. GL6 TaxID=3419765 RepID=UPI003D0678DA